MRVFLMAAALAAGMVCAVVTTARAQEMSEEQKNVIIHGVNAVAIIEHCPDYELDTMLYGVVMMAHDIKSADFESGGRFAFFALAVMAQADEALSGKTRATACAIGNTLYGPDGQNVPGLIKLKGG